MTLDDARRYAALGLNPIPLGPKSKLPALDVLPNKQWEPYQVNRVSDDDLVRWFGNGAKRNAAIVLGQISGVVVVDSDTPEAEAWCASNLPPTPMMTRTARGLHRYYRRPDGDHLPAFLCPSGLRIELRRDGQYVVAPGSVHPDGTVYSEVEPWPVSIDAIPDFPVALLVSGETQAAPPLPTDVPSGQRNEVLFREACRLRRLGWNEREIVHSLTGLNDSRCSPPLDARELETIARSAAKYPAADSKLTEATELERARREARRIVDLEERNRVPRSVQRLVALPLPTLRTFQFPERRTLLTRRDALTGMQVPVFREGHLGQLYGGRGTGKTFLTQSLAMIAASGASVLGFSAPEPCRVLYVDGEMDSREIQERFELLGLHLSKVVDMFQRNELFERLMSANLTVVAADWQETYLARLDTAEGQSALEPYLAQADLIILDNRSCLFDPEGEKDAAAWQPAQDWLLSLRRRGKAVLVVHHSNRQGGARGHSKSEDPMNLLLKLTRPEDYSADEGARFVVEFDKIRGAYGAAVAPFVAALTPDGWQMSAVTSKDTEDAQNKLRDYLRAENAEGRRPKTKTQAVDAVGGNRNNAFAAWAAMVDAGEITRHTEGGYYLVEGTL